jgi:integrase/recombinase XerC
MDHTLDAYTAHLRASGARPRTRRLRLDHAAQLLALGEPATITTRDIEAWMNPPHRDYAAETLRSRRASARRFYTWLHTSGAIPANPAAELRPVRIPAKPPRIIPDSVFRRALANTSTRDRGILMLGRFSGLRLSEIAELRIEHRDGERLTIEGKGGDVRHVMLTHDLEQILDELADGRASGYYFPGRFTGHLHRESVHKIVKRVTGGWNPHSLRHGAATAAYRGTRDLRGVQAMLGHKSLATTQRYLTVSDDEMRALARAARGTLAA